MKIPLVITSINPPTKAVKEFAKQDLKIIVVGDYKSPKNWSSEEITFLSLEDQQNLGFELEKLMPKNAYSRKNLGYLYAMRSNPDLIAESDDDNIPYDNWLSFFAIDTFNSTLENQGFVNVYSYFTDEFIWPRGLPLDELRTNPIISKNPTRIFNIGMYQGLANQDPDVDAIYRLVISKYLDFNDIIPLVLGKGTIAPMNTQNTITIKKFFPLMYLSSHVPWRFTDILRGLIAQPIMWLYDFNTAFFKASVYQDRNPHDLMRDFGEEIECYIYPKKIIELIGSVISSNFSVEANLIKSYEVLIDAGIVDKKEIILLKAWLNDLDKISQDY